MKRKTAVLVVARYFPPVIQAASVMLGYLFRWFPAGTYCVLTGDASGFRIVVDESECFPEHTRYVFAAHESKVLHRDWLKALQELAGVPFLVAQGMRALKKEGADAILGVFPTIDYLIAAYALHRLTGKPFFVYLFDPCNELYAHSRVRQAAAQLSEERILQSATKVFVMSEALQEHYAVEHNITHTVIFPQPVDISTYAQLERSARDHEPFQIVYTGNVHDYVQDSLLRMAHVANRLDNVQLVLYTQHSDEDLAWRRLCGPGVISRHVPRAQIPSVQVNADVLFLPMAFEPRNPFLRRVSAPGKMGEYLAAGRPILLHAPTDAYVSWYSSQHGFALQVNEPDEVALRQAVLCLQGDPGLRLTLSAKARTTALHHDSVALSRQLQSLLLD